MNDNAFWKVANEPRSKAPPPLRQAVALGSVVCFVAIALRFWDLDAAPLWMDEAFTVLAGRLPLRAVLLEGIDNHPPLSYALQSIWTSITPNASLARAPAAAAGAATVVVLLLSVRKTWGTAAGLWAAALLAVAPSHVWFSQDARMYPILLLGLAIAVGGLLGMLDDRRNHASAVAYVIGGAVAIYSHFVALPFLFAMNVAALTLLAAAPHLRNRLPLWLAANVSVLTLSVPWLLQLLRDRDGFPGLGAHSDLGAVGHFLRNAVGFPSLPPLANGSLLLIFGVLAVAAPRLSRRLGEPGPAWMLLATIPLYLLLIVALDTFKPLLATRIFLPLLLPLVLLAGASLATLSRTRLGAACGFAMVASFALATILEHPKRTKHDAPASALAAAAEAGFQGAPILTCNFVNAAAYALAAEEMDHAFPRVILDEPPRPLRFETRSFTAVRMSMAELRRATSTDIDAYLGGGLAYEGGLLGAVGEEKKAILIAEPCPAAQHFREHVLKDLQSGGFHVLKEVNLSRPGRPIMEAGDTLMLLLKKTSP